MAKYKGAYKDLLDNEEEVQEQETEAVEAAPEQSGEEETFKKRYGDLRRHMQETLREKDKQIAEVKEQLSTATKAQIKFPKSEEEVASWVKKYPDVAKIIDTIAQKRVLEGVEMARKDTDRVKELEDKLNRTEAEKVLKALHPDFDKIRADSRFHDWVAQQPGYIQDALYKNNTDAKAAARAIDLYKADRAKVSGTSKKSAASSVTKGGTQASPTQGKAKFTESAVAKMSTAEYERNEAAIMDAMREGNFEYDLSAGAR